MQEGIGQKYSKTDRASEDHVNINGEVFKLDQTLVQIKPSADGAADNAIHMSTYQGEKKFSSNYCNVVFTSEKQFTEGVNLVLIAQRRYWHLGTYEIECSI